MKQIYILSYIYIYIEINKYIYGQMTLSALLVLLLCRDQYPKVWGSGCGPDLGVVRREGVGADKISSKSKKSRIY